MGTQKMSVQDQISVAVGSSLPGHDSVSEYIPVANPWTMSVA